MAKDRQSSWASGELASDLHGQAGSPVYQSGAALLRNFMVTPQGTVVNRTGSEHLATLGSLTARLEPFLFGDDPPRLVQLYWRGGSHALRDANGALVGASVDTAGETLAPGGPAQSLKDLRECRVAQCAGTMMVANTVVNPFETRGLLYDILRSSSTAYVKRPVTVLPHEFGSSASPYSSAANKTDPAIMTAATGFTIKAIAGDATHPPREWMYAVTRVVSIEDGNPDRPNQIVETAPAYFTLQLSADNTPLPTFQHLGFTVAAGVYTPWNPVEIAVYGDWNQRLEVPGAAGDPWTVNTVFDNASGTIVAHRIYRGRNGVMGYIGETTTRYFVDDGRDPDIANPPPTGSAPFVNSGPDNQIGPLVCAFKDNRRFFGAPGTKPNHIEGSAVGDWSNFDPVITPDDADALALDLAANEHQSLRHLLAGPTLLAFTSRATWAITGSGQLGVLTPTDIAARKVLAVGSAHYPAPMEADGLFFLVEDKGRRPYRVEANGDGAAQLTDLAILSSHFFKGRTIVSWAWQRDPHLTLWVVLDDGALLSLCSSPSSRVLAWARHELAGGGLVESVATIPVGGEDLLYMVVRRGAALNLERLAPQVVTDARLECYLDCAKVYDGRLPLTLEITSAVDPDSPAFDMSFDIGAPGNLFTVGDTIIFPDANGNPVTVQVLDVYDAFSIHAAIVSYIGPPMALSFGYTAAASSWGKAATSVATTLPNDTVVSAVIDGAVVENLVVAGGAVALPFPGVVCIVGLPYKSQMQALPVEQERGKQKQVTHVYVETIGRGGAIGADFESLQEIPPRLVSDGYGIVASKPERTRMAVPSSSKETATVVVEQSQPKPFKILAVEREYILGS